MHNRGPLEVQRTVKKAISNLQTGQPEFFRLSHKEVL